MKNSVKFTFDTHFDGPSEPRVEPRSRKSYSAEEIEQIREAAREEGRRASDIRATQAGAASIGQGAAAVLSAVQARDGGSGAIRAATAALAPMAAKKPAGPARKRRSREWPRRMTSHCRSWARTAENRGQASRFWKARLPPAPSHGARRPISKPFTTYRSRCRRSWANPRWK